MHAFHIDDLRDISPLWLHFTERIRKYACEEPQRFYELASPKEAVRSDAFVHAATLAETCKALGVACA